MGVDILLSKNLGNFEESTLSGTRLFQNEEK